MNKWFAQLFQTHKMHLLALLVLCTDRNDRFRFSFIYLGPEKKKAKSPHPGTETIPCSTNFFKNHNCGTELRALLVAVLTVFIIETIIKFAITHAQHVYT